MPSGKYPYPPRERLLKIQYLPKWRVLKENMDWNGKGVGKTEKNPLDWIWIFSGTIYFMQVDSHTFS